jgi:hypothetical protein
VPRSESPSPGSPHGATPNVEIRCSSSTHTVGVRASMGRCTCSSFTGNPPKRSFKSNPRQSAFSSRFRDESCVGAITVSRRSKIGSHPPHANMHRCDRNPKISIQPAPSHHQSPTCSQTVRRNGLGPITVSRRSKIGPITFPHQHACKPRYDRIPKVSMQHAPSHHRSSTRSQTVRRNGHSPTTASRRSKIGPVDQPHHHACKSRLTGYPR